MNDTYATMLQNKPVLISNPALEKLMLAQGAVCSSNYEEHRSRLIAWIERYARRYMERFEPRTPVRCLRHHFTAGAVRRDTVFFPSYNGAPRGSVNCDELGSCNKQWFNIPVGGNGVPHTGDEYCPAVHAEENVVCAAARMGFSLEGADLFVNGVDPDGSIPDCTPCYGCSKLLRSLGLRWIITHHPDAIQVQVPEELKIVRAVHSELIRIAGEKPW